MIDKLWCSRCQILTDSPRIFLTVWAARLARKVPRKALMKVFCRSVTFWYWLGGSSSRLGRAGSRLERKSITETGWIVFKIDKITEVSKCKTLLSPEDFTKKWVSNEGRKSSMQIQLFKNLFFLIRMLWCVEMHRWEVMRCRCSVSYNIWCYHSVVCT